jgi:hypothetical protein
MEENTLDKSLDHLRPISQFQEVTEEIASWVETIMDELRDCPKDTIDRKLGELQAYREIVAMFRGQR